MAARDRALHLLDVEHDAAINFDNLVALQKTRLRRWLARNRLIHQRTVYPHKPCQHHEQQHRKRVVDAGARRDREHSLPRRSIGVGTRIVFINGLILGV